jgi:selenide,water dikinase
MPVNVLPAETIRAILAGGAEVCAAAGVPVAGGHSIDSVEPIYGLVALGLVHPERLLRNSTAKAGDVLILTKPLGVGVLSAAFRQGRLSPEGYAALIAVTTQLNRLGADLPRVAGVHAVTDVTGFGLAGHVLEMCRAASLTTEIDADALPLLPEAEVLIRSGVRTGASARNWESYGDEVDLSPGFEAWRRDILTDPQTSGGLLIAVAPDEAERVLTMARQSGPAGCAVIGRLSEGASKLVVLTGAR